MKRIFIFLPLLLLLPVLALGQDRFNEVGAVYGAIRSMTPEAYKEAHDKYGIRWHLLPLSRKCSLLFLSIF